MPTQEQIEKLADLRMRHDCAQNSYGGYKYNGADPAIKEYQKYRDELGLGVIEAENITWPVIAKELYA